MIKGVHHVALSSPNLQRLCGFYCEVLGFEKVWEGAWEAGSVRSAAADQIVGIEHTAASVAMLSRDGFRVEIFEYRLPVPKPRDPERRVCDHGYTHLCLEVEDIDAEFDRLEKAGMTFHALHPPAAYAGQRAIYGRDPDGNVIELYEIVTKAG